MRTRTPIVIVVLAALLLPAPAGGADLIELDFETGSSGFDVTNQYARHGVTFPSDSYIVETTRARSGHRAVGTFRPADEFPSHTLTIDLAADLGTRRVEMYLGLEDNWGPAGARVSAVGVALGAEGGDGTAPVLASEEVTFTTDDQRGAPVATLLRLALDPSEARDIVRVEVTYDLGPPLVDDLLIEATTPRDPGPPPGLPPRVSFTTPEDDSVHARHVGRGRWSSQHASVLFEAEVAADAPVLLARAQERRPSGRVVAYTICGGGTTACGELSDDGTTTLTWTGSYLDDGDHQVTLYVYDELGREGVDSVAFEVREQRFTFTVTGARHATDPIVDNFAITLQVPAHRSLQRVTLEIVDNATISRIGSDNPRLNLFGPDAISNAAIEHTTSGGGLHTLHHFRLPLPLWHVGPNRLIVSAVTTGPDGTFHASRNERFAWQPPSEHWGIQDGGQQFRVAGLPARADRCPLAFCKDADQDGLLDLWENIAVESLRPRVTFDEAEDMLGHAGHTVRTFVRISPTTTSLDTHGAMQDDPCDCVIVRYAFAYTRDYGDPLAGFGDHNGDVQTMQEQWELDASGERMTRKWSRGSVHFDRFGPRVGDWHLAPTALRFGRDGVLTVWAEEDKHGTWHDPGDCEEFGSYDCNHGPTLRPAAVNVGEEPGTTGRAFVDDLDALSRDGPYSAFSGVFPHEAVWTGTWWPPGDRPHFCGGLGWDGYCANHIGRDALQHPRSVPRSPDGQPALVTNGDPA